MIDPNKEVKQDEEELRNTWRRGPPKITSHKLPSAFGVSNNPKKNK